MAMQQGEAPGCGLRPAPQRGSLLGAGRTSSSIQGEPRGVSRRRTERGLSGSEAGPGCGAGWSTSASVQRQGGKGERRRGGAGRTEGGRRCGEGGFLLGKAEDRGLRLRPDWPSGTDMSLPPQLSPASPRQREPPRAPGPEWPPVHGTQRAALAWSAFGTWCSELSWLAEGGDTFAKFVGF